MIVECLILIIKVKIIVLIISILNKKVTPNAYMCTYIAFLNRSDVRRINDKLSPNYLKLLPWYVAWVSPALVLHEAEVGGAVDVPAHLGERIPDLNILNNIEMSQNKEISNTYFILI